MPSIDSFFRVNIAFSKLRVLRGYAISPTFLLTQA
jgi:hypothetical protein